MENCEFDATPIGLKYVQDQCAIENDRDLHHSVQLVMNGGEVGYPAYATWNEFQAEGVLQLPISAAIINAILKLYPSMPRDLLTEGTYMDFLEKAASLKSGLERWEQATIYIESNRGTVAEVAKAFYANVDDSPDFPLITEKGWLLEKLQPLSETDTPPSFQKHVAHQHGPNLPGWISKYTHVKKRCMAAKGKNHLWNGDMYRVMEVIVGDGRLDVTLAPGRFYDYIDNCEVLGAEIACAIQSGGHQRIYPEQVPMRGTPDQAFELWSRMAPIGISCLTILKNYPLVVGKPPQNVFLMHERGMNIAAGQNTWHVTPAGGHAPVSMADSNSQERLLWSSIVREFVEECFNAEDAQKMQVSYDTFMSLPTIKPFIDNIFRRKDVSQIFLMGVALEPVTLAFDAMVAIVIDWAKAEKADWSALPVDKRPTPALQIVQNYEAQKLRFVPLTGPQSMLNELVQEDGKSVYPAGQACLLRGAHFYDALIHAV